MTPYLRTLSYPHICASAMNRKLLDAAKHGLSILDLHDSIVPLPKTGPSKAWHTAETSRFLTKWWYAPNLQRLRMISFTKHLYFLFFAFFWIKIASHMKRLAVFFNMALNNFLLL